ncbi:MAG: nucleoside recognition protein [Thermodesulfobacteriota bacterium]
MAKSSEKSFKKGLYISGGISLGLLIILFVLYPDIEFSTLSSKLLIPVGRILLFVTLGLVIGEIIESTGWTKYLAFLAGPLFRFAHLGYRCSAAFTTAFFSGIAANGLLLNYYREGQIGKQQLFLTNFMNHFPAFFLHLPTTVFIVLPLAGYAGGVYLVLVFLAVLLRTLLIVAYGRLRLPVPPPEDGNNESRDFASYQKRWPEVFHRIRTKTPMRAVRIIEYVIPIYLIVFLLEISGVFDALQDWLSHTAISAVIPLESLSMVVVGFLADYASGFATAGALIQSGALEFQQAVLALVIGNVVATPLRAIRHQLPRYLGVYTPKLGTQLLLVGQSLRAGSLLLVGGLYFCFI